MGSLSSGKTCKRQAEQRLLRVIQQQRGNWIVVITLRSRQKEMMSVSTLPISSPSPRPGNFLPVKDVPVTQARWTLSCSHRTSCQQTSHCSLSYSQLSESPHHFVYSTQPSKVVLFLSPSPRPKWFFLELVWEKGGWWNGRLVGGRGGESDRGRERVGAKVEVAHNTSIEEEVRVSCPRSPGPMLLDSLP